MINFKKSKNKSNLGITLIALVVTVIVLLILLSISIAVLTGEKGIVNTAINAKEQTEEIGEREKVDIAAIESINKSGYIDENKFKNSIEEDSKYHVKELDKWVNGENYLITFDSDRVYSVSYLGDVKYLGPIEQAGIIVGKKKENNKVEVLVKTKGATIADNVNYVWSDNKNTEPSEFGNTSNLTASGNDATEKTTTVNMPDGNDNLIYLWVKTTIGNNEVVECLGPFRKPRTLVAKQPNTIEVTTPQTWVVAFSTSTSTKSITPATNAQGTVTYEIMQQKDKDNVSVNYFSISGTTLSLAGSTPINKSPYVVVIRATASGNSNYEPGYKDITVNVTTLKVAGTASVTMEGWRYGETPNDPVPVSSTNGTSNVTYKYKVSTAADSTYTQNKPTTPGTYTVQATFAETENYEEVVTTANFEITKANMSNVTVSMSDYFYGLGLSTPSVSSNTGNGTVTFYYNTQNSNSGGNEWTNMTSTTLSVGTYYMYAKIGATANYNEYTTETTQFEVEQAHWRIGSNYYKTLSDAVSEATNGDTIVAYDSHTDSSRVTVNKTITINTNGKTITLPNEIENEGTLTITGNGTIISTGEWDALINFGILNITGATIRRTNGGHAVVTVQNGGTLNMTGGRLESIEGFGVWMSGECTFIMDGGEIEIFNGIGVKANNDDTFIMNGGKIESKYDAVYTKERSTFKATGGTLINHGSESATVYASDDSHVELDGILPQNTAGFNIASSDNSTYSDFIIKNVIQPSSDVVYGKIFYMEKTQEGDSSCKIAIYGPSLSNVQFQTWTDYNGQDDIITYNTTNANGWHEATVYKSEHNGETGIYNINMYDSTGLIGSTAQYLFYGATLNGTASVTMANWVYGETPSNPVPTSSTNGTDNVTYKYKVSTAADSTYTTTKPTNAGTYTVQATFAAIGNYYQVIATTNFTIAKANIGNVTVNMSNYTYGGTVPTPTVSSNPGNGTVTYYYNTENSNSGGTEWSNISNLSSGTYYIYAVIGATNNYNAYTTGATTFTVNKVNISSTVSMNDYYYGLDLSTPSVSSNPGNGTVTYYYNTTNSNSGGTEWTNMTSRTLNVGTYYMYAVIGETTDYNGKTTATTQFEVKQVWAEDVSFTPEESNWNVNNVQDALDDLYELLR